MNFLFFGGVLNGVQTALGCESCRALHESLKMLASKAQGYYEALTTSPDLEEMRTANETLARAVERLEMIWKKVGSLNLTTLRPCKLATPAFAQEGKNFLETVNELQAALPSAPQTSRLQPLTETISWAETLEALIPPADFENRLSTCWVDKRTDSAYSCLVTLATSLQACSTLAQHAVQDPRKALCRTVSAVDRQRVPEVLKRLADRFQTASNASLQALAQTASNHQEKEILSLASTYRERTTPAIRTTDRRPTAMIPEEAAHTLFIQDETDQSFLWPTETSVWNVQTMDYKIEATERPVRVDSQTQQILTPPVFQDLPCPKPISIIAKELQAEVDFHLDEGQRNLDEIIKKF